MATPAVPPGPGEARWQWPLRPPTPVLRRFDPPAHPWESGHRGVDLAAPPGRPVFAAGAGRVTFARDLAGRGVITISHGTLRTTYLPVRPVVRTGQTVVAGTRIGVVEAMLGHCGQESCLHWGLLRGDSYLDPLSLLGLGPVRLLPWWHSWPNATVTGGEGRSPRTPTGPAQQAERHPVRRPIARPPASSPDDPPSSRAPVGTAPARTGVGTAPAMRPVGATTGIGAIVDPVAITAAAGLALFGFHTRRRMSRIPTRPRRHDHRTRAQTTTRPGDRAGSPSGPPSARPRPP
ncbi:M23 family metallopeptidase [Actinoallomurus rhizosphaericola]|uniref:M23 family metallopeptidase n=1 Tax=Actinoallomurus rhizosphaericola TaxID=2952536 RepID=UPI0020904489|nr:M23 family metallopeptidase [Actinoallomurus rhizosphaericola]MCO5992150.1 M23 family metallopeptidase [Actinoallomurus rhizosphaericola]